MPCRRSRAAQNRLGQCRRDNQRAVQSEAQTSDSGLKGTGHVRYGILCVRSIEIEACEIGSKCGTEVVSSECLVPDMTQIVATSFACAFCSSLGRPLG